MGTSQESMVSPVKVDRFLETTGSISVYRRNIWSALLYRSNIASPHFTGEPKAPDGKGLPGATYTVMPSDQRIQCWTPDSLVSRALIALKRS